MSQSTFVNAQSVFVPSHAYGEGPVRYRCQGCGELLDGRAGQQHTVLDCLTIFSLRLEMLSSMTVERRR